MARTLAKTAQILVSASSEGTPAAISPLASWDFDESSSEIDVTGIYDTNKQYVPGQAEAKGSFTLICDSDDDELDVLSAAHSGQTLVYLYVRLDGTGATKPQIKIPAYITGWSTSASTDDRVEISATWVAGGAIDRTAQAANNG